MKRFLLNSTLATIKYCICLFIAINFLAPTVANSEGLDGIAAIVNKHVITQSMLNKRIQLAKAQMQQQMGVPSASGGLSKQVLQQMIDSYLLLDAAEKQGIQTTDDQLNQQLRSIAAQNHMTLAQLDAAVQKQGYSIPEYRKHIRDQMTIGALQQKVINPKVSVSKTELASFSDSLKNQIGKATSYHLAGVVIKVPQNPSSSVVSEIKSKVAEITTKLKKGEDPQTIAVLESSDAVLIKGGDMGWRPQEQLPPALISQLNASPIGKVMSPFQTSNGIYVVRYLGKQQKAVNHDIQEYHLRHILVRTDSFTNASLAREKLLQLRNQILTGSDFAKMAEKYSQDTDSAVKGGDLGWLATTSMPQKFAQVVPTLKDGEMSQPFEISGGVELIQVLGKRTNANSQDFINSQVKQVLSEQKFSEAMQSYLQALRGSAYIKVND